MESTNALISATIMPTCNLLVSRLILFVAFLPAGVNVDAEGEGAVAGGGVGGDCINGIVVAGLCAATPAMFARVGGGVRGDRISVTAGRFWTLYLAVLSVS